ncbi:cytochrome ubiquinol oxidase subunit I [Corynebacterium xerosis]|uniref:cytochrome ubiquinol oxidase subunit I n=1 Tax=Corynebacterium xerosis TaxID=1725 RepID=UPI00366C75BD
MDVVDVSRWQFGITTVYHFIFVPLTIGLAPMVALMQTMWQTTGKAHWYRATRFFGTVFLINFAMGVATGIVQEFQFGMNWSEYSRMVGDVFGGPLALEGLIAFFLESTFLGLWIFGWGRIPGWLHTASIWLVAVAVNLSAYFIIVANSFMQHPVGAVYNPDTGRAELTDIVALLTNPTALAAFPHAVAGSFLTAGTFVLGVTGWWMVKAARLERAAEAEGRELDDAQRHDTHRPAHRLGWWTVVLSSIAVAWTGDIQAKLMFVQQPMKMASAESLCVTETDPRFSVLSIGTHNNCESVVHVLDLPWVLPFLAEGKFSGVTLEGVLDLQQRYEMMFGPGNYQPNLFVTYWSFRAMIGLMVGSLAIAFFSWLFTRGGRLPRGKWATWFAWGSLAAIPFPFLANSAGWVFTEMGRQPWVVHPNPESFGDPRTELIRMTVDMGVSDHATWTVVVTLVGFTLIYAVLAVVWFMLIRRVVLSGPPVESGPTDDGEEGPAAVVGDGAPVRFAATAATGTDAATPTATEKDA